ncbi:ATP-binding protein [Hydrogeniiclostridium mannosilyticum]|uniref:ATP-binding protein n=2 Tax=Hydrogeniiclostridium mannosilyticum TaxID=2764322 RepID=A0A328UBY9_9FIRM|nr:ATP-binding protein [Hydrogeniiclostridium mannosilyticum]
MASLSVYRGILKRTVPKALFRLLWAEDEKAFLQAWGSFLAVLCERGFSENLMECISQTALFDENAFSLAAAAGETEFPPSLMAAVEHDLKVILDISALTPEDLLRGCPFEAVRGMQLPGWQTGEPMEALRGPIDGCISRMAAYYRANGCGMYARYRAFIWRDGAIQPVAYPDKTRLQDLKGYDVPRREAIENTLAFLEGLPANNCLMYGDRGTGKSSTVKALLNEFYPKGLRVIEMPKESLMDFPKLVDQIAAVPMKFIIFIDDLSFSNQDDTYAALKAVLQGGLAAQPDNALIYATSNRRHLVRETFSDREGDELHRNDTIQESLSLADRFGLAINFSLPDKQQYLEIVRLLAVQRGLEEHMEELERGAEMWAIARGGRSPRCAQQFIAGAESRIRRGIPVLDP